MVTGKAWTDDELSIISEAYMVMLRAELLGIKYNKSGMRRNVMPLLDGRSEGSYEMKMCNLSAVLRDNGYAWIKGYKPRDAYQKGILRFLETSGARHASLVKSAIAIPSARAAS